MASQNNQDWQTTKKTVLERNCHMFNNPLMSDISFSCGEFNRKYFYVHKYVLATSSPVFYAMFYGRLAEKVSTIHLLDTDEESLHEFLRFLYTDECILTPELAVRVIYLAKKYIVPTLAEKCIQVIQDNINPENALSILEHVILYDEQRVEKKCWEVIDMCAYKTLASEAFMDISHKTLISLLKRKTLNITEVELFQAMLKWSDRECLKNGLQATAKNRRALLGDALYLRTTHKEFALYVSFSGLLTADEIVSIFEKFNGGDHERTDLKWKQSKRQPHLPHLEYFTRFPPDNVRPPTSAWSYRGKPDHLSFCVNTFAMFHGVCLFGDANGSKYEVSLEVNGVKVRGTYFSEAKHQGIYGFDVILPEPISVNQNTVVTMAANIAGPNSCYGNNGQESVEVDGVQVTFSEAFGSSNGTGVAQGQFYQIILSF